MVLNQRHKHRQMRRHALWPVAVLLIALLQTTPSAEEQALVDRVVTMWTSTNGFGGGDVWAITQDADGYLWLSTSDSLIRFDGFRFETRAAVNERVSVLLATHLGDICLGSRSVPGVTCYHNNVVRHYTPQDGLPDGPISALLEDRDGIVWAAGEGGLSRLTNGRWERVTDWSGWRYQSVYSLYLDRRDVLWIASRGGIYRRRPREQAFEFVGVSDPADASFVEDPSGAIWATDPVHLLRDVEHPAQRFAIPGLTLTGRSIRVVYDRRGDVWIATPTQGLFRVRQHESTAVVNRLTSINGLGDTLWCLYEDREGNIWAGTKEGLARISKSLTTETISGDFVHSVTGTADGSLWLGTDKGLRHYSSGVWQRLDHRNGLPGDQVLGVHEDRDGSLWLGTSGGPAHYIDGRFDALAPTTPQLTNILSIATDHDGGVWFCDQQVGVFRWKDGALTHIPTPSPAAYTAFADRSGRLWFGFFEPIIVTYMDGRFNVFSEKDGLAGGSVNTIYQDHLGDVWVGSKRGITQFRDGRPIPATRTKLSEVGVSSITEDRDGYLWLGTSAGLFRVSPQELSNTTDESWNSMRYTLYDTSDGLPAAPLRRSDTSATRDARGSLWFITGLGVFGLAPADMVTGQRAPDTRIVSLSANSHTYSSVPATLAAGTSALQIDYTALTLSASKKVRFRYKLDGFDRNWVYADFRRQAFYTNLGPGGYTFRVGATIDGLWSQRDATLSFSILPTFYQTKWFAALVLTAVVCSMYGLLRLRVSQLHKQYSMVLAERARLGRDLHDTLLQGLFGVALRIDTIVAHSDNGPAEALKPKLMYVRTLLEQCLRETRHSIWNLRSPSLLTNDLPTALRKLGEDLTAVRQVSFDFCLHGKPREWNTQSEDQILRVGEEVISNAVRHSEATVVRVNLDYGDTSVRLLITDNGHGFNPAKRRDDNGGGFGLITMHERADQIGGTLSVKSSPATGTRVELIVPTSKRATKTARLLNLLRSSRHT